MNKESYHKLIRWVLNYEVAAISLKARPFLFIQMFDLLTKTKYIKLSTKTQNIFCRLNENSTTFLYTLTGKTKGEKKVFSFKVYTKVECY